MDTRFNNDIYSSFRKAFDAYAKVDNHKQEEKIWVVFLWYGVLTMSIADYVGKWHTLDYLSKYVGTEIKSLHPKVSNLEALNEAEFEELYKKFFAGLHVDIPLENYKRFYQRYTEYNEVNKPMLKFVSECKEAGANVALLAGITPWDYKKLSKELDLNLFDKVLISYEIGKVAEDINTINSIYDIFTTNRSDIVIIGSNDLFIKAITHFGYRGTSVKDFNGARNKILSFIKRKT